MDYETVKKRLLDLPKKSDLEIGEGVTLKKIEEAQEKLKKKFPKSYRQFLLDFGHLSIGSDEIFGLGDIPAYLDVVKNSLDEWNEFKPDYFIPDQFIPFCAVGNGDFHSFDTTRFKDDECPVVWWSHEDFYEYQTNPSVLQTTHESFPDWLNEVIDRYLKEE